jgi:hypothetical protein
MSDDNLKQRFLAAFPWWEDGKARLGWRVEVNVQPGVDEVRPAGMLLAPLLAVRHNPQKDHGNIRIHMPGATREQITAVEEWLAAQFDQVKTLPAAELRRLP